MELDPETVAALELAIAAARMGLDRAEGALEEIRRRRAENECGGQAS